MFYFQLPLTSFCDYEKKNMIQFGQNKAHFLYFPTNKAKKLTWKGFREKIMYAMGVPIMTPPR